uniref:Uncharacterized protein n=1 Tax=Anguilla anguilla TaxID=7936 RepID=A0A0E9UR29_ANGAN
MEATKHSPISACVPCSTNYRGCSS